MLCRWCGIGVSNLEMVPRSRGFLYWDSPGRRRIHCSTRGEFDRGVHLAETPTANGVGERKMERNFEESFGIKGDKNE